LQTTHLGYKKETGPITRLSDFKKAGTKLFLEPSFERILPRMANIHM
jgi:hypothetical protein